MAIPGLELALEIRRPDRVGVRHGGVPQTGVAGMRPAPSRLHQVVALE